MNLKIDSCEVYVSQLGNYCPELYCINHLREQMIKIELGFTFGNERKTKVVELPMSQTMWDTLTEKMKEDYINDYAYEFLCDSCEVFGNEID